VSALVLFAGLCAVTSVETVGSGSARDRRSSAAAPDTARVNNTSDPQSLPPGLWLALAETRQREGGAAYGVRPMDDRDGAYRAANPAQQFETMFRPDGVRVTSIQSDRPEAAVTLRLAAVVTEPRVPRRPATGGREGRLITEAWRLADARVVRDHRSADGQRVAEWYLNGPMGLEQGFTIQAPSHTDIARDADTLRLTMDIGDQASAAFGPEGDSAVITDPSGQVRLAYGAVDAWDATGRRLPARLEPAAGTLSLVVTTRDAHYPLTIDPIIQQAKLTASDGAGGDRFGWVVALSGDTALVGAVTDDGGQGSAYVFTRSGGVWTQQAKLTASDGAGGDQFGIVALSGDTALVGAQFDNVGANTNQGSAYVFTRSGGVWTQQAKLTASDGAAGDEFGFNVALSGDTALVGAIGDDVGANGNQGSAYVFTRSSAVWTQQAKLTASDGAAADLFGDSGALSGDTALVGAFLDDVGANGNQGSAYVFTRSGGVWTQQAQLTAGDGATGDQFGQSVALSGDTALVGAFLDDVGANGNQGSAYVFIRSGGVWTQQAKLTAGDGAAEDRFGHGLALSGDTALVGSLADDVGVFINQGSAYVFTRSGGVWTQQAQLTASDLSFDDRQFGNHVALSGQTALVGARFDDVGANVDQGSAYVFTGVGNAPPSITSVLASPTNLFPGDRRMVRANLRANLTVVATDDSGLPPTCAIDSVVSNQAPRGVGPDIIIYPPLAVDLRAERPTGGANRKYTITVKCTDGDGAFSTAQKVVEVTGVR
jgi:hypothetical protein